MERRPSTPLLLLIAFAAAARTIMNEDAAGPGRPTGASGGQGVVVQGAGRISRGDARRRSALPARDAEAVKGLEPSDHVRDESHRGAQRGGVPRASRRASVV